MKLQTRAILVLAAVCWRPAFAEELIAAKWGPATNGVQIALVAKPGDASIKRGQPLAVSIRLHNCSSNETVYLVREPLPQCDPFGSFRVLSPSGRDVSPRVPQGKATSLVLDAVGPSESKGFDLELTRLCKFEEIGTYRVVATRQIWRSSNQPPFVARSASLPLTIIPGRWGEPPKTNAPIHW